MSEAHEHNGALGEEVTGIPVLPSPRSPAAATAPLPAAPIGALTARATALAATGFVAGAATVALLHRRRVRRPLTARALGRLPGPGQRRAPKAVGGNELLQIVASRSLLVDVHLLGGRD